MFPSFMKIIGNWFDKKILGVVIGVYTTCVHLGNIVGLQIATLIMDTTENKWYYNFLTLGGIFVFFALLMAVFLQECPLNAQI